MCRFRVYGVQDGTVYSTCSSSTPCCSSPTLLSDQLSAIKNELLSDQEENGADEDALPPAEPECLLKFETDEVLDDVRESTVITAANMKNNNIVRHSRRKTTISERNNRTKNKLEERINLKWRFLTSISPKPSSTFEPTICKLCNNAKITFHSLDALVEHLSTCHDNKQYVSRMCCGQAFTSKTELQVHRHKVHGGKTPWQERTQTANKTKGKCPFCKKQFLAVNLEAHLKMHSTIGFPCSFCDKNFAHKNSLERHIEKKHKILEDKPKKKMDSTLKTDRSCICELCGKLYKGPKGLSYHMLLHTGEHPHVCQQCGQAFIYKNSLSSHMIKEHGVTSPYICSICGKVFLSKTALVDHERKHTGERPYACDVCHKAFSSKAHLSTHKYDHVERQMKCSICDATFNRRNEYYRHRARYHLPPRKKNHQCAICGVAVTSRKALEDHLRVHTKEKPFQCDLCYKRFGQKDLIMMHIKSHLQIRPIKCNTCGKCFPNKQAMVVHERIHTGERPHVCRICHQSFNQINSLKRHMKLHNAKYHLCNVCGRDFDVKSDLRLHHRNDHGSFH